MVFLSNPRMIFTSKQLNRVLVPGTYLVDMLPWLKYIPEWVPGAGFQRRAREWSALAMRMADLPFADAKRRIVSYNVHLIYDSYTYRS